jgi:hypothetical protein
MQDILDQLLLPLADQFEAGQPNHWYSFKTGVPEYEKLRECLAVLVAEGSVLRGFAGHFQFTKSGYSKYLPRVKALRALSAAGVNG